jgi:hypothetical protein
MRLALGGLDHVADAGYVHLELPDVVGLALAVLRLGLADLGPPELGLVLRRELCWCCILGACNSEFSPWTHIERLSKQQSNRG